MERTDDRTYAGDVLLLLGALALFGPWGAAGAVVASLVRHSPLIVGGALELAERASGRPLALPDSPRVAALLPAAATLAERPPREAAPRPALLRLEDIADLDNLWVVGPKGSGKTTVLRSLLRLRRGAHVALDPHNTPGKWPCKVVGGGRRYEQIAGAIEAQVVEMGRRYTEMDAGRLTEAWCAANRRTLVGDEWLSITKNLPARGPLRERGEVVEDAYPGAAQRLLTVLTEGRKAGIAILTAAHVDTATGMGLSGERDILDCFDRVIYLGAMATKRHAPAARMARPAVVYDPERNEYTPLDVGAPVVAAPPARRADPAADAGTLAALLGADLPGEPADRDTGTRVVPAHWDAVPGVVPGTGTLDAGTGSPDDAGTGFDRELADALIAAGWSANRIYAKVGGKRAAVLAYVRERRDGAESVDEPPAIRLIK